MSTDMQDRVDRLDAMIEEDRIIREQWTDGHERACLLAAISPEAGRAGSAGACPAHVMPAWLAHLTPWIDDSVSADAWPGVLRRYASLARRWGVLDDAAWERARVASLIATVSEARTHCPPTEVCALAAIDGALEWLRCAAPEHGRMAAAEAASMAAEAASMAAEAASMAVSCAAEAASMAPSMAVGAGKGRESAAAAAASWAAAARAAASDRIAAAVLDAIEAEIERSEKA